MANPTTASCPVQIQIWVDDNAVTTGSSAGVYLVDNRILSGSQSEGSANLTTACSKSSGICWQVYLINPTSTATVQIQSISNSPAWGFSGQPQRAPDNPNAFTGTAENAGAAQYTIGLNVQVAGGSGVPVSVTPSVNVSST